MCPYKYNSGAIRLKIDILFPLRVFKNKLRNDLKQKRKTVYKRLQTRRKMNNNYNNC